MIRITDFVARSLAIRSQNKTSSWADIVSDYGADPKGNHDSSSAFQKAVNELNAAGGGRLVLPIGTFRANFTFKSRVLLSGSGKHTTSTVLKPASTGAVITFDRYVSSATIEDLAILGNLSDPTNDGILMPRGDGTKESLSGMWECTLRNLTIQKCGQYGINMIAGNGVQAKQFCDFSNIDISSNKKCGWFMTGFIQNNEFRRVTCRYNQGHGMIHEQYSDGTANWNVNDNLFSRCLWEANDTGPETATFGLYTRGFNNTYFSCWFEGNGTSPGNTTMGAGYYGNHTAGADSNNLLQKCTFSSHHQDVWFYSGGNNELDECTFNYNGVLPTLKTIVARAEIASPKNALSGRYKMNVGNIPPLGSDASQQARWIVERNRPNDNASCNAGQTVVNVLIDEQFPPMKVLINPQWTTNYTVSAITKSGFTVTFTAAPAMDTKFNFTLI